MTDKGELGIVALPSPKPRLATLQDLGQPRVEMYTLKTTGIGRRLGDPPPTEERMEEGNEEDNSDMDPADESYIQNIVKKAREDAERALRAAKLKKGQKSGDGQPGPGYM